VSAVDIVGRLQQLEDMVKEARSMPLSTSAIVNRDELLEVLEATKNELPEEIKQARWVVKDREELLTKARRDAEALMEKARAERDHIVSEQEIVRTSKEEAERILSEAGQRARELRLEAEDYIDAKLAQFEIAMEKTSQALFRSIGQVQKGRERLRGGTAAQEEFGGAEAREGPLFDGEEEA
jgi:cell division septum initiation protein DivIVA